MRPAVEVWAGIECSYNRIGDRYFDQVERSGGYARPDDVDRLAGLGVSAIRFPVIWERYCALGERAWEWTDAALERLRRHGVTPIVGLVHHGSGPVGTSLVDSGFPEALATFAREVARRYPWVRHYTPINEPLTTARFATLYGHWYPHGTSPQLFARAMIVQARGVSAAMRAIAEVTPHALLVQTEDFGRTYASAALRYQADFENERRWLTFDLLCGRVRGSHPMAAYLRWAGIPARELDLLAETARAPDVIGINHYLTSERYLDDNLDPYPSASIGGNGTHRYADVEAVRVLGGGVAGAARSLREAWDRYGIPGAVTEAHLGCTREQQLRWLREVWDAATALRSEGADIRAVTAWSAFGAYDWSSLLTRVDGKYEPGLFDVRAPSPRQTALGRMVRSLATTGSFAHPAVNAHGWWHSQRRLTYPPATPVSRPGSTQRTTVSRRRLSDSRPVLIVGAHGTLGRAFARACDERGLSFTAVSRQELDITDAGVVEHALADMRPWAVINCAGFVRVDDAERARRACHDANVTGPVVLAGACADVKAKLVTFSSDLVFDGRKQSPYVESDAVRPLCAYGSAKARAEVMVLDTSATALVVRTAAFFGDHDDFNFVTCALRALTAGARFDAANDATVSPTYVPDLVDAVLDLAIDDERGLWHLANDGAVTWETLARHAAEVAGVGTAALRGRPGAELFGAARRPRYSALASERAAIMPPLDDALSRYARARPWDRPPAAASSHVGSTTFTHTTPAAVLDR